MDILVSPINKAHEKIYNLKSNCMIIVNGLVYCKLLCDDYIYWKEERLLILPLYELLVLKKYFSFILYRI